MDEDEVLGWRYPERLAVAASDQAQVPVALLADPHCDVRNAAAGHVSRDAVDAAALALLRDDPCPRVRHTVLHRFGPDPAIPLHELTEDQRIAAARSTGDPAVLAVLATDPSVDVRLQVARNQHCPAHLLVDVARHPVVFGAALANPAWPAGVRPPDPFEPADH
jgi:hypothetical protein